ncbi:AI-2E family transporter [Sphaerotilus hippei]|uniref:AI-2E family transporter n=1 Tax=Sphaerotilus hippei TaxID=744406 RepID=UPI0035BEBD17
MQQKTLILLLVSVTAAFGWVLWPFFSVVFWAAVLAVMFMPLHRRLLGALHGRPNLAAVLTLLLGLVGVVLPLSLVGVSLVHEGVATYHRISSGEIDLPGLFDRMVGVLPQWATDQLDRFGLGDLAALRQKISAAIAKGGQAIAGQALALGQNTFELLLHGGLTLYLLFFFLRDGASLTASVRNAVPLSRDHKRLLFSKFITVIRATVKGNIAVAATQGLLGGLIFWILGVQGALLWSVLMGFMSLVPAVGAGLIWVPVAIYFLATGALVKGLVLIAFGVLVIGLVDNLLRPILVGKDTQLPDYVVLISTLGGLSAFGINGFVIGPLIAALFIAAWDLFVTGQSGDDTASR